MNEATTICRICGTATHLAFTARVLAKYDVAYFECEQCRFVQTERPYWLKEAYEQSINAEDTGIVVRNLSFADRFAVVLFSLFGPSGRFLDYAGGYGLFTRIMRDRGFDFYWRDLYSQNLLARGFELPDAKPVDAVTTFESFEHFSDPITETRKLTSLSDVIFFSTELIPMPTPVANAWWYYGHQHGQHIAFYRTQTLRHLATQFGLTYFTNGRNLHAFSKAPALPYCLPDKYYRLLIREKGKSVADCYSRVKFAHRPRRAKVWLKNLELLLSDREFYILNRPADGDLSAALSQSKTLNSYLQYLLIGRVEKWNGILRARLVSRTQSDMEHIVAMRDRSRS